MNDAFERRALLLHLGDALHAMTAALAANATCHTVRELLNAHADLATYAWLAAVSPDMKTTDFAKCLSASFALWPEQLLEAQVDYPQLALAVRSNLFADNARGWDAYVDALKREVQWFGDALPDVAENTALSRESGAGDAPTADTPTADTPTADTPTADTPDTGDAERADEAGKAQRETAESNKRLYPSWPWKPGA